MRSDDMVDRPSHLTGYQLLFEWHYVISYLRLGCLFVCLFVCHVHRSLTRIVRVVVEFVEQLSKCWNILSGKGVWTPRKNERNSHPKICFGKKWMFFWVKGANCLVDQMFRLTRWESRVSSSTGSINQSNTNQTSNPLPMWTTIELPPQSVCLPLCQNQNISIQLYFPRRMSTH